MTKKKAQTTRKSNAGRKFFDGKDEKTIIAKLEQAAALDADIPEMCFYADISRDSYYRYINSHEEFRNRIEALRQKPCLAARQAVVSKLGESYTNAMDYLARKKKKEFSPKQEVEHSGEISNVFKVEIDYIKSNGGNKNKVDSNRKAKSSVGDSE